MTKPKPKPKPAARKPTAATARGGGAPAARQNPRIQTQTRRVLVQHYRAKYGVK